jgi:hypothetical protein
MIGRRSIGRSSVVRTNLPGFLVISCTVLTIFFVWSSTSSERPDRSILISSLLHGGIGGRTGVAARLYLSRLSESTPSNGTDEFSAAGETLDTLARNDAMKNSNQCGGPIAAIMPASTLWANPREARECDVSGALAAAVRGEPQVPLSQRTFNDAELDGDLSLPEKADCPLVWYSPSAACSALADVKVIVLVGDSLMRHLGYALRQVASGSFATGAFAGSPPSEESHGTRSWAQLCHCDEAYRICSKIQMPPTGSDFAVVCPSWPIARPPPLVYFPWWGNDSWDEEKIVGTFVNSSAAMPQNSRSSVLVIGYGPAWAHIDAANFLPGAPALVEYLDKAFATAETVGARVVCMTLPAPIDGKKPSEYVSTQGDAPTRTLNSWLAEACTNRGGDVLDAYALTVGTYSRDGTHYQTRQNALLAQALLNIVERQGGKGLNR